MLCVFIMLASCAFAIPQSDSTLRHHRDKEYAAVIATTTAATAAQLDIDAKCEYTRDDCIDCATRHADIDKDGRINQTEVDILKARMLSWWQRDLAWFARYTTEYIMYRCADADGFITARSFQEKRGMCLEHCADWMHFMPLCMPLDRHKHAYAHNKPVK